MGHEWYKQALDGREKTLGNDHSSALDIAHNMGSVFDNQGEYGKALEFLRTTIAAVAEM